MRKLMVVVGAVAVCLAAIAAQAVVINEFYYGTDPPDDNEWIELYNRSATDIDLTNWKIAVANNGPFTIVHTITTGRPDAVIRADDYFLITDSGGSGFDYDELGVDLGFGRDSGSAVFGIALIDDNGTTIDTVLYGPSGATNVYNLKDDDGETTITRVKVVSGDQAYSRDAFHTDTNDSSVDFYGTGDQGTPVPVEVRRFSVE